MPMSAPCRRSRRPRRQRGQHGYTLLEMVVVLTILGLVVAMAAPALLRSVDSWRRQAEVDALVEQIRALPARARASGRPIAIDDDALAADDAPLRVAERWQLRVPTAWTVHANGVCDGGEVWLDGNGRSLTVAVAAPFCEPRVGGGGDE